MDVLMNFPTGKYTVIYADPAWSYKDKAAAGNRGVEFKYPTMTIDDIKALPVADIAADDAVLFLWVTWPLLDEGIDTIRAWGFKYKTLGFVWIKLVRRMDKLLAKFLRTLAKWARTSDDEIQGIGFLELMLGQMIFWGMGNWTRSNSEVCLMGVRGKPKRVNAGIHSVILAPIREHSQKPDEARGRIEHLLGDVPRVELFARTRAPGWDTWGNQVDTFDADGRRVKE